VLTIDTDTAEEVIQVRIPAELRRQLDAYCALHRQSIDDVVTRAVWEELVVMSGEALPSRPIESPIDPKHEYTVDEVIELCRDQWILMRVTGFDDHHRPAKGFVLAHSFRRAEISRAFALEPRPPESSSGEPRRPYSIFRAFQRLDTRAELERLFADLGNQVGEHLRVTVDAPGAADGR
jgi:hypothetical protein